MPDAVAAYREALQIQRKLSADFPDVIEHHRQQAELHRYLGTLLDHANSPKEAEEEFRAALTIRTNGK